MQKQAKSAHALGARARLRRRGLQVFRGFNRRFSMASRARIFSWSRTNPGATVQAGPALHGRIRRHSRGPSRERMCAGRDALMKRL